MNVQTCLDMPLLTVIQLIEDRLATDMLGRLLVETRWNDGFYLAFGRRFPLPRLQAWYADEGIDYCYAENLLNSNSWSPLLLQLREQVNAVAGERFNAVLVNRYRNGQDSVGWHADNEADLGPQPVIASLSFGAARQFCFRRNADAHTHRLTLENGSLLLMKPPFQQEYEHAVLPEPEVTTERINLTFRRVVQRDAAQPPEAEQGTLGVRVGL